MRKLCQACVMLKPEKHLHIPHDKPDVENDIEVCIPCFNRLSLVIANDTKMVISAVGSVILGIQTQSSAYDDYAYDHYGAARF